MKPITPAAWSRSRLSAAGAICLAAIMVVLVWALLPVVSQDPSYHQFADQRQWLGVPRAADVLSNLVFALVGFVGVARLASNRRPRFSSATEAGMWCVAVGLVCTAMGSAWYHLNPTDSTLFWDRLPMTLVFTGVLGAAISQRVGNDVGRMAIALLVPLGIASVVYWKTSADLSPYLTLQFGGIGALLLLLVSTSNDGDPIRWAWVVAWYVLAKMAEFADHDIWNATRGLIAGHMLKHLLAAAAGAAVLWPLLARR